jgi:hypothetical protein
MIVATDIARGAHAVERLVQGLPISRANADDARAALRLAYTVRALCTEHDALQRRVAVLEASLPASELCSEPESQLWAVHG